MIEFRVNNPNFTKKLLVKSHTPIEVQILCKILCMLRRDKLFFPIILSRFRLGLLRVKRICFHKQSARPISIAWISASKTVSNRERKNIPSKAVMNKRELLVCFVIAMPSFFGSSF